MKLILPGGGGHIGTLLARAFQQSGDEVVVLSRKPAPAPWRVVAWDGENLGDWARELEGADALINLAGRSVNCRYGPKNRQIIYDSRLKSTKVLADAVARCAHPPAVWLQSSTATIYAHRYDAPNDEATGVLGCADDAPDTWKFSYDVATRWEKVFNDAPMPRTRKVLLRTAIVMSPLPGQAFDILLRLVRFGLGGRTGDGQQFVSWIHGDDFCRAARWLIEHPEISGPVNLASPNPLPNADFMRALRGAWGVPFGLPAMEWQLEIAAFFMRTESELVLKSRRVVPRRLLEAGFHFDFPSWPAAARELCERWRKQRDGH